MRARNTPAEEYAMQEIAKGGNYKQNWYAKDRLSRENPEIYV